MVEMLIYLSTSTVISTFKQTNVGDKNYCIMLQKAKVWLTNYM